MSERIQARIPPRPPLRGLVLTRLLVGGRRWSLHQPAHRLLDESSEEEDGGDVEEEGSSPGEIDPDIRENKALSRTRGSRPFGQRGLPVVFINQIFIS
ncbi:UNVERIFIED_CONTAM: hypothetical protein Sradi_2379800 [Sesamum radiatum]|uniref:Uncharacterized protein n=1 Tax=Sesamum radiatum TaxID=300843 RepID=A0AAW2T7K5_SESRA